MPGWRSAVMESREVMNVRQASQYLGISPDTLFRDVTVERIWGDPQILRRLPHIHYFARFHHSGTPPRHSNSARIHSLPAAPRRATDRSEERRVGTSWQCV